MEKIELVERAKMYLKLLSEGVNPVTGDEIPGDSAFLDEKVIRCFSFFATSYKRFSCNRKKDIVHFSLSYFVIGK